MVTFKPNRKYPTIPTITGDLDSHTRALQAIAEAVSIHERRTKDIDNSFVRVHELVDMGLISLDVNDDFNVIDVDLGDIADTGDLSGASDGDFLRYDDDTNTWVATTAAHSDLTGLTADDHLHYMEKNEESGPAVIEGGIISDAGGGSVNVTAGTGFLRVADDPNAEVVDVSWEAEIGHSLTDGVTTYVYITYDAGETGLAVLEFATALYSDYSRVLVGIVLREGTTTHITQGNVPAGNVGRQVSRYLFLSNGAYRVTGLITTESGTRKIANTGGFVYTGLNEYILLDKDTNVADTFIHYYRDGVGGWTAIPAQTQISNQLYDNNTGVLATLASGRHTVHWVFRGVDGQLYVLYGEGDYTLAQAQQVGLPANRPPSLQYWHSVFCAKIIIQKNDANFTSVAIAFTSFIGAGSPSDHSSLAGLTDDDHPQYAAIAQNETISEQWDFTDTNYVFNSTLAAIDAITGFTPDSDHSAYFNAAMVVTRAAATPAVVLQRIGTSYAAATQVLFNESLGQISWQAHTGAGVASNCATIDAPALENISPTNQGVMIRIRTKNEGGTTLDERARFGANATGGYARFPDGALTQAGIGFFNDINTGWWRPGTDNMQAITGGALAVDINSSQRTAFGRAVGSLGFRVTASGAAGAGSFLAEDTAVADGSLPFSFWRSNAGVTEFGNANRSGTGTTSSTVRMAIASGSVLIGGLTSTFTAGGQTGELIVAGSSPAVVAGRFSADTAGPVWVLVKSRNATVGSSTVVQDGDTVGSVAFAAADGTDLASLAARILVQIDGTPGTDDVPGSMTFQTTADGAAAPTTRTTIRSDGSLRHLYSMDLSGKISPTQLTANTDDYIPTSLADVIVLRLSTSASWNLTGVQGGRDGRILIIINVGTTNNLVVKHDVTSTAANRFYMANAADTTLGPHAAGIFWYDSTSSRWRMLRV